MLLLETFTELVKDPAHWQFELLVGGLEFCLLDVLGAVLWRWVVKPHIHRDIEEGPEGMAVPAPPAVPLDQRLEVADA